MCKVVQSCAISFWGLEVQPCRAHSHSYVHSPLKNCSLERNKVLNWGWEQSDCFTVQVIGIIGFEKLTAKFLLLYLTEGQHFACLPLWSRRKHWKLTFSTNKAGRKLAWRDKLDRCVTFHMQTKQIAVFCERKKKIKLPATQCKNTPL